MIGRKVVVIIRYVEEIVSVNVNDYGSITIKLAGFLEKQGISRMGLAKAAKVDYRVVNKLCKGDNARLDVDVLTRICFALECTVSDLIEYNDPR